jgi:hypothetical protein
MGWLFWALLLLLPFMRHPQVPTEPALQGKQRWLPWLALALLALTIMPEPFTRSSLQHLLH